MNLRLTLGVAVALFATVLMVGGVASAQPIGIPASGCQESGIVTSERLLNAGRGGFTQERTVAPGDQNVVLGAWAVVDTLVVDPAGNGVNCLGGNDFLPTYVTYLIAFLNL